MKLIIENPARYGYAIKANQLYQPLDCDTFVVAEPVKDSGAVVEGAQYYLFIASGIQPVDSVGIAAESQQQNLCG